MVTPGKPGEAFQQTLTATGGTGNYTWSIVSGTLPTGLQLSSSGVISGTSTQTKPSIVTVQATGSSGMTQTKQVVVDVVPHGQREVVWQASGLNAANVPSIVADNAGTETMPIWYVMQMFASYGIKSTWNGHTWNSTTSSSVSANANPGTEKFGIYVNGNLVQNANGVAAVDPNSKKNTMFMAKNKDA
ncbi:hypothetical protein GCM10025859_66100 [Alicyclobacillus fastidiosus]|nr:putative Ig domain-containing protein [Alicyclobacillus fastidiosus]GMA65948.1 hypothetical protein GCM10025859_63900 [Alicyclobacillus fastidiosus]GMA66168.1 hypothetical protein GCM10025859_66100 [Alicyclobacillus fastidiosus]